MASRKDITKRHPLLGWFQYSNRFNAFRYKQPMLPKLNPYIGTFRHSIKVQPPVISQEQYEYNIPLESLMLYFKTLRQPIKRSVATQTDKDEFTFVVLELPNKN